MTLNKPTVLMLAGLALAALALYQATREDAPEAPILSTPQEAPVSSPPAASVQAPAAPSFDVVRIGEDGNAVMAGRAPALSQVSIMDGETVLGTVQADERGEWVFVPDLPLSSGTHELNLRATLADGQILASDRPVILLVPEGAGEALAFRAGKDGHQILQGPAGQSGPVVIDLVTQTPDGLHVTGRGQPNGRVFLYGDNQVLGEANINEKGQWNLTTKATPQTLRADLVDNKGKVLGRVEIPTDAAPLPEGLEIKDGKVVVQKGASLWRIAQRIYGSGLAYTLIFEANQNQIRNPDLIYPGQVFQLPRR